MPEAPAPSVSRSDGIQPPGGWPLTSCLLIAADRPGNGLGDSTGKSVPNASLAPLFSTDCQA